MICSYLNGRTAKLTLGRATPIDSLTRGCPQGSIFGPTLWNITMEALLKSNFPNYARVQAYADDIAVSIHGGTKIQVKQRAEYVLNVIVNWGFTRKLKFSTAKLEACVIRGNLVPGFYVNIGEEKIRVVNAAKYLGVWIDKNLSFRTHVQMLKSKDVSLFSRLRSSMGKSWGMSRENAFLLYKVVFLPKVTYAAKIWSATQHRVCRRALEILQRTLLLGISSAYNTTSTHALQVITGSMPLHLVIRLQAIKATNRNLPQEVEKDNLYRVQEIALEEWQHNWDNSKKGRWTYRFFPNVRERLLIPLHLTHFLSGHGNFRANLFRFRFKEDPFCQCGFGEETAEHLIFSCVRTHPH